MVTMTMMDVEEVLNVENDQDSTITNKRQIDEEEVCKDKDERKRMKNI